MAVAVGVSLLCTLGVVGPARSRLAPRQSTHTRALVILDGVHTESHGSREAELVGRVRELEDLLAASADTTFLEDAERARQRRNALDAALGAIGVGLAAVDDHASALAMYNRFVEPRRDRTAASAYARQPLGRLAAAAAHNIAHIIRRAEAEAAAYIRTCDEAHQAQVAADLPRHPITLILDNVRSAYNVGSLLRTADTARCCEVIACGYTPRPPHPKIDKTAFAAAREVKVRHFPSTLAAVRAVQAEGTAVWAMETTGRSKVYTAVSVPPKVALVLGNEEVGVDPDVLDAVDELIEIPTFGRKNSLNVACAAPVVVFECLRQWGRLNSPLRGE